MLEFFDIQNIIVAYGYLGIFLIIFLESGIFFPLPGDSLLFAAGLFAATGGLNVFFLFVLVFTASWLGILSGYYVGGRILKLRGRPLFRKILKQEHLDMAGDFFARHGRQAIVLSRFVPIVRTFVPITAGAARMDYLSFVQWSFLGSLVWSGLLIFSGFFLGRIFPQAQDYFLPIVIIIIILSLLPGIFQFFRKKHRV